jgi:hypothetical protein
VSGIINTTAMKGIRTTKNESSCWHIQTIAAVSAQSLSANDDEKKK